MQSNKPPITLAPFIVLTAIVLSTAKAEPMFTGLGFLPGDSGNAGWDVSSDGPVVVGFSYGAEQDHAFRWEAGVVKSRILGCYRTG